MDDTQLKPGIAEFIKKIATDDLYEGGYALKIIDLCKRLNLEIYVADFIADNTISGTIEKNDNNDTYSVYVNKNHHPNRRRFTAAHEIGHYISFKCGSYSKNELETKGGIKDILFYRKTGHFSRAETEANQIAAEILMPKRKVEQLLANKLLSEEMAEKFLVSHAAMIIRLKTMCHFDPVLYEDLMVDDF